MIVYNDRVYTTEEDLKLKPKTITLIDNGLSEDDFMDIMLELQATLNGGA
jgi:hypothetical protein